MRKSFSYFILVVLAITVSMPAPQSLAKEFRAISSKKISGTWKFTDPANGPQILSFDKAGNYQLDFDGDGKKDIWGLYRISQDWIILNDIGGDFVFDCGQQGAYAFSIVDDVLTFRIMADQCPSRSQAMNEQWTRVIEHKRIIEPPIMMKI